MLKGALFGNGGGPFAPFQQAGERGKQLLQLLLCGCCCSVILFIIALGLLISALSSDPFATNVAAYNSVVDQWETQDRAIFAALSMSACDPTGACGSTIPIPFETTDPAGAVPLTGDSKTTPSDYTPALFYKDTATSFYATDIPNAALPSVSRNHRIEVREGLTLVSTILADMVIWIHETVDQTQAECVGYWDNAGLCHDEDDGNGGTVELCPCEIYYEASGFCVRVENTTSAPNWILSELPFFSGDTTGAAGFGCYDGNVDAMHTRLNPPAPVPFTGAHTMNSLALMEVRHQKDPYLMYEARHFGQTRLQKVRLSLVLLIISGLSCLCIPMCMFVCSSPLLGMVRK